jgi:hypothetical protein
LTPEEAARYRAAREEFAHRPSWEQLMASGDYTGPMSIEEYFAWLDAAGESRLDGQLQAAIRSCGETLTAIAKGSGVSQPVLQRFMSGERGITLATAGKLAAYLHLRLLPQPAESKG